MPGIMDLLSMFGGGQNPGGQLMPQMAGKGLMMAGGAPGGMMPPLSPAGMPGMGGVPGPKGAQMSTTMPDWQKMLPGMMQGIGGAMQGAGGPQTQQTPPPAPPAAMLGNPAAVQQSIAEMMRQLQAGRRY